LVKAIYGLLNLVSWPRRRSRSHTQLVRFFIT